MNPSNSQSTCRICMRKNSSMKELFGSDCKIVGRIEFCTGIIIRNNPNLSTSICDKCLSHLSIAHDFKTTCIVSDKIFNKLDLKVEVKRGMCDNVTAKKNFDEFRIEIDSTTKRFVVKKLEPTKNIILKNLEPTKNIILKNLEPTKNIILKNLEPTKNIILNKLEPTKNILKTLNPVTKEIVNLRLRSNFCKTIKLQLVSKEVYEEATLKAKKGEAPQKRLRSPQKHLKAKKGEAPRKRLRSRILQFRSLFCTKCDIRFESKQESIEHYVTFHNIPKQVCEVCGKQFVLHGTLQKHKRTHDGPSLFCAHCSYGTGSKSDLIVHLRSHTGERKYQCHVCPHVSRTCSNLHAHIRFKHGGLKRFPCNRCDKSFYDGTSLRRHLDGHENIKRFECSVCHSLFTDRHSWKRHLLTIHGVTMPTAKPGRRKTNIAIDSTVFNKDEK